MKVLAWVPQPLDTSPGQRFRIEQWAPHLTAQGIEVSFSPFAAPGLTSLLGKPGHLVRKATAIVESCARRLVEAARETRADLVYIFREGSLLGPALAERVLTHRRIPFVFDFDDAVWMRYVSPANGLLSFLRFPGKTATLCRQARQVMAGNAFLRDYARRYNPRVTIVPTSIDTEEYVPLRRQPGPVPIVGWSGSFSTVQYLDLVRPALERLAQRRRFRLKVVGGSAVKVRGVEVECLPWRPETEVSEIGSFDVGLMPLPYDEWARGKCGLKALQYMALEVPAVVSPVGVNAEIVEDGQDGLLASTEDDWVEAIDRLLGDETMRLRMGREGRRKVEAQYSARAVAPLVARLIREAAS